jgi:hypothetical protein
MEMEMEMSSESCEHTEQKNVDQGADDTADLLPSLPDID